MEHNSLELLEQKFKIKHRRHERYPNLVQLKYNQIESDFNNELVRQCRGLILDEANNWAIAAWPFDKFGNYGEGYAAQIDWNTARIQEKLDGSLIIMYHHDSEWMIGTSGTPDASGEVNGFDVTFHDLFWTVWRAKRYNLPTIHQKNLTFMFEFTSPLNKIVVNQIKPEITLIGVRNRNTGQELPANEFLLLPVVREFATKGEWRIEDVQKSFASMDPTKQEGYVVVDADFNRIKVKHPGYVILHHLRDRLTPKGIVEIIRKGEVGEVVANFPEWRKAFDALEARYDGLAMALEVEWLNIKDVEPRKNFAELAMLSSMPTILFLMKDGKTKAAKDGLATISIDRLMEVLSVKEIMAGMEMPSVEVSGE